MSPTPKSVIENYMVRPIRERMWEDDEYNLFNDPDYLFELAAELAEADWERIKAEKGDE